MLLTDTWASITQVLLAAAVVASCSPERVEDESPLHFSRGRVIDLGSVKAGSHQVQFSIRNDTAGPVHFSRVSGSCTCMDLEFTLGALQPGEARVCSMNLAVSPNQRQESLAIFDTDYGGSTRFAVAVSYVGVPDGSLRLVDDSLPATLGPSDVVEVDLSYLWSPTTPPDLDSPVALVRTFLGDPLGVSLVGTSLVELQSGQYEYVATLRLRASELAGVAASIRTEAGFPTTSTHALELSVPVSPSLTIEPNIVLIHERDTGAAIPLRPLRVVLAAGWSVTGIAGLEWITTQLQEDQLFVTVLPEVPSPPLVERLRVSSVSVAGQQATRSVSIVLDY